MALSENSRIVFDYVKENSGKVTAADIAEATGLNVRQVNGIVTSAFQRKELMERIVSEVEVADENGNVTHKPVKLIALTEKGAAFDPDAEPVADAE